MVLNQWVHSGSEESWLCSQAGRVLSSPYTQCSIGVWDAFGASPPAPSMLLLTCTKAWKQNLWCSAIPKLEEAKGMIRHLEMSGSIWGVQCSCQWGKGKKGKVWLMYSEQSSPKAGVWLLWWSDCVVPTLHKSCSQFFLTDSALCKCQFSLDASSPPQLLFLPLQLLYLNTYISSYLLPAFWCRPPVNSEWLPEAILTASTSLFSLLWSISIVTFAKR